MPYNKAEAQRSIEVVGVPPPPWWLLAAIGAAALALIGTIIYIKTRKS